MSTHSRVPKAFRPERSVNEIVAATRAIRWWVDEQIKNGRSDAEIEAMAPLAIGFINGDISISELEQAIWEARQR